MKNCIFTVGCSASGKSTFAHSLDESWIVIERDLIRSQIVKLENPGFDGNIWEKWKFSREKEVNEIKTEQVEAATEMGFNICFSDTNLNPVYLNRDIQFMESNGYNVEIKLFDEPIDVLIERDKNRLNSVGEKVIRDQFEKFKKLVGDLI